MRFGNLIAGLALAIAPFAPLHATLAVFTDKALFDAAATTTSYGFASVANPNGPYTSADAYAVGPATFTAGAANILFVLSSNYPAPAISAQSTNTLPSILNVALGSGGTAFGLNLSTYVNTTTPLNVTVNGQNAFSGTLSTTSQFLGFLSTDAISSLSFSSPGAFTVDSTQFQTNAVPGMATWAMMIGGLGIVGGTMRQRGRKVQASLQAA